MQSTKKRNLILTLLVGLLMSVLAFVGISLAPKTAFADANFDGSELLGADANFDGSELLGDKVQVGDSLVGKTIKFHASMNGDGTDVIIKTQNYEFVYGQMDPMTVNANGVLLSDIVGPNFTTEWDAESGQIQYFTFKASSVGAMSLEIDLTNETVTEIIGDDVYYVETDDSTTPEDPETPGDGGTTTDPEDPGTTPEDPEDPGTTPEDPEDPGTTPEDPETPGDDVTLLPDVSEETTKWGEVTETVANWFSENTGLKITGSFVSIALFVIVLSFIFKKK